ELLGAEALRISRDTVRRTSPDRSLEVHLLAAAYNKGPEASDRVQIRDNRVDVRQSSDGPVLATLMGHRATVGDARFSPDGRRLVTASSDGTARIWDLSRTTIFQGEPKLAVVLAVLDRTLADPQEFMHLALGLREAPRDLHEAILRKWPDLSPAVEKIRRQLNTCERPRRPSIESKPLGNTPQANPPPIVSTVQNSNGGSETSPRSLSDAQSQLRQRPSSGWLRWFSR